MPEFKRSLAVVIGINHYVNGIPELKTAVNDANQLALLLEEKYQYQVLRLLDTEATKDKLTSLFTAFEKETFALPDGSKIHVEPDDRLLFYFAGHGFAQDAIDNADGPVGFLVLQDGQQDHSTWLPMQQLHDALVKLPCRHMLIILDCCFAGTFRWAGRNREVVRSHKLYQERYDRYIAGCAQQVITSAAHDEKAADYLYSFGHRSDNECHSPFAELFFKALSGEADFTKHGVITATELYVYLRDNITSKQTPQISLLKRHDKGEYIFPVPGFDRNQLEPAPKLNEKTNPYKGLASFEQEDSDKFFGRTTLTQKLQEFVMTHSLTVVLGASGAGKSSLVKAGLIPQLKKSQQQWRILPPIRPGEFPFRALKKMLLQENLPVVDKEAAKLRGISVLTKLANWSQLNPNSKLLLVIDQCEELVTLCRNNTEREKFLRRLAEAITVSPEQLRLVLTLRNDFEPQLSDTALKQYWTSARFLVPGMKREELRQAIVEPATARVMFFAPPTLVDQLIDEVMLMPGTLPLLSFTLSELYLKYIQSVRKGTRSDRAIAQADYEELGGVTRSLTQRADFEYEELKQRDEAYELTVKQVMLRMVAVDGGELARRKVLLSELEYPPTKNERVQKVIRQFTDARLLVEGQDLEGNCYVEPAHDALVRGWQKLLVWKQQEQESLILQRRLTPAAIEWKSKQPPTFRWTPKPHDWFEQFWTRKRQAGFLWDRNPRLNFLQQLLDSTDNWFNTVETEFVQRSLKRQRNNRRRTIGLVTTGFAVVLGFAGYQWYQMQQAQIKTLIESSNASFASGQQLDALIAGLKAGKKLQTLRLLSLANADTQRQVVKSMSSVFYAVKEFNRLEGHKGGVHCLSFSPDGQTIATASADNTVKLWKRDGTFLDTLTGHSATVHSVSFSPDGQTIATASADQTVRLWKRDGTSFKLLRTLTGHGAVVTSVSFSPDGQTLASASWDNSIILWDRDGNLIRRLSGHNEPVVDVSFSPDGQMIASGSWNNTAKLWKRDGTLLNILKHNKSVRAIRFSPDGQTIATADDSTVRFWKPDGTLISPLIDTKHSKQIDSISFSPDGQTIATASEDNTIKLWKRDGTLLHTLTGHSAAVDSVSFSPDGKTLASASWDGTVKFWKLDGDGTSNHQIRSYSLTFSPDGQTIATVNTNTVELWKKDMTTLLHILTGHGGPVYRVSFSPDGQMIATASEDKTVKLWKRDGSLFKTLIGHGGPVYGVSFSPDSQLIASASDDKTVKLWKRDGTLIRTLNKHSAAVAMASFSPDGQTIASSSNDSTVKLWKLDGTLLHTFSGHSDTVHAVSFSPDNQTLASASWDGTVKLWNRYGSLLHTLNGHNGQVWDVSFSFDGKTLASASWDKTVKLWRKDGTLLSTLTGHNQEVYNVSFSPDGKTVASGSADKAIMWNLDLLDRDILLKHECEWVRGYLKTNSKVTEEDRHLCDDI